MEAVRGHWCRLAVAVAAVGLAVGAPGKASADGGAAVFPGMEIHQGSAVCMVGFVEPRLRVALTTGQCDGGASVVTDRDHNVVGTVALARRQAADQPAADTTMQPVEYEVISLAPGATATDLLPTGRHLRSVPGVRVQPGLPVCQFRRSDGQRCGAVSSVGSGRFVIPDMLVDSRDFGGPVYALTDDNGAVLVGLFEGMFRSTPQVASWQAIMQQVATDGREQPSPGVRVIAERRAFGAAAAPVAA